MANSYFQFKQFTIHQEKCAMKVGTDGVLLGAWADLREANRILDIGTGSGLIALMAAQRSPVSHIEAIEIDSDACEQAKANFRHSPWAGRLQIRQGAIQHFYPSHPYDSILCNPPFFINSTLTPEPGRTIARHCTTLTHIDLFQAVQRLLSPNGNFHLILPVHEAEQFISFIQSHQWFVNKITRILPTPAKPPKRYLLEISREQKKLETGNITIEIKRHTYHESFIPYVKDFYLHL